MPAEPGPSLTSTRYPSCTLLHGEVHGLLNNMPLRLHNASMQLALHTTDSNHQDVVIIDYIAYSGSCRLKHYLLFLR